MPFLSIAVYILFALFIAGIFIVPALSVKALFTLGTLILFYAHLIEPYRLQVKKINFAIPALKKPIKIVFIADLQVRRLKNKMWLRRVVNTIIVQQPNYVFIGGDFIFNQTKAAVREPDVLLELKPLTKLIPTIAVLGNHEYGRNYFLRLNKYVQQFPDRTSTVIECLREAGVRILSNELLDCGDFLLYGTDDLWAQKASWDNLQNLPADKPLIVLTHNPDTILTYPATIKKPSLVLAGHTHGGQVQLPFIGPLGNSQLKLGRKFDRGFKTYNGIPLFITHGLGESDVSLRLAVVPEIVVVNLTK